MNNKLYVAWLHNAHAMETEIVKVLEAHADQAEDYPDVHAQILKHLEETKRHAEILENVMEDMDEDPSAVKEGMGNIMGMITGASTALAEDRLVKNAIAEHATEHFEMASYEALIAAAEQLGHNEAIPKFQEILKDEEEMADWLKDNLPECVKMVLEETAGEE